jgi:transcriptional regulator of arginine metabolism
MPTLTKTDRRALILEVLDRTPVQNQAELAALLAARGVEVNQATLSRDLRDLGLVKTPAGYAPADGGRANDPQARLGQAARTWLRDVVVAQNLVVLKTPPGGAQPLALALDQAPPKELIATLGGDDTVLAIGADARAARRLAKKLEALRG